MVLEVVNREKNMNTDVIGIVLTSAVAKNIFLGFPEHKRYDFIRNVNALFSDVAFRQDQIRLALGQRPFATYLLVQLIDRD
jgi:hypothetical protein